MPSKIEIYNQDCMEAMAKMPDKAFDLAIVDPPYGINYAEIAGKQSGKQYGSAAAPKSVYAVKNWDKVIPPPMYYDELFRISKEQVIWGANYMVEHLIPKKGWIFWDKDNGSNGFSDGELAYTSFDKRLRMFKYTWNGMIQQNMKHKEIRNHPTQKPVALYKWLLNNYAKEGDRILDTHLGSGSIAIACYDMGFDLVGYEIDKDYFDKAKQRIDNHMKQGQLF
jgi:site-specific DNA-methyltransferase (adenine-specific)